MCGISGVVSLTGRPVPVAAALAMQAALSHRGPDGQGVALFPDSAAPSVLVGKDIDRALAVAEPCWAVLCHNRLAILDLSPAGLQPMASRDGRWWTVFNGEIYNFVELRSRLPFPEGELRSRSDTEVLVELWPAAEEQALRAMNGMWAFAMLNPNRRELVLCRDRFGVKPLYYARAGDWLLFASEIKALFVSGLVPKRLAHEAIGHYLAYGVYLVQGKATFYEGVEKVLPSTLVRVRNGAVTESTYYALPDGPPVPSDRLIPEARALFEDAVRVRLRSDVPVATCLSGGVDSTNVVAFASRLLDSGGNGRLRAYTIDVGDRVENEIEAARTVAEINGCEWRRLAMPARLPTDDVFGYVLANEEPQEFLGSIVQYLLYRRIADDGVRVVLDGQGGDEAFGGYTWFYYLIGLEALRRARIGSLLRWIGGVVRNGNAGLIDIWRYGRLYAAPERWGHPEARALLRRAISPPTANATLLTSASCRTWRERKAAAYYKLELQSLLRDADRNGMRWPVEARFPFLDYRLVELTHNADPLMLTRNGWSKYVSRSFASDDMIPSSIRWSRFKKGFYIPIGNLFPQLKRLVAELAPHAGQSAEIVDWPAVCDRLDAPVVPLWRLLNVLVLDITADLVRLSGPLEEAADRERHAAVEKPEPDAVRIAGAGRSP